MGPSPSINLRRGRERPPGRLPRGGRAARGAAATRPARTREGGAGDRHGHSRTRRNPSLRLGEGRLLLRAVRDYGADVPRLHPRIGICGRYLGERSPANRRSFHLAAVRLELSAGASVRGATRSWRLDRVPRELSWDRHPGQDSGRALAATPQDQM